MRPLRPDDLPDLLNLSLAAGWNQTGDDWRRLLMLAPNSCFGVEASSHVVASSTLICYAEKLAWLGMVLTLPSYRGRGFARRLVEECLKAAGGRVIKLDASDQGRPLYLSLGFRDECSVERWALRTAPVVERPDLPAAEAGNALDFQVFGADRIEMLKSMSEGVLLADESFALHREGRDAAYFGPCVSKSIGSTRMMLDWALSHYPGQALYWDLFPHQADVVALAREKGFVPVRRLMRMVRGASPSLPDARYHAIAGFELG